MNTLFFSILLFVSFSFNASADVVIIDDRDEAIIIEEHPGVVILEEYPEFIIDDEPDVVIIDECLMFDDCF